VRKFETVSYSDEFVSSTRISADQRKTPRPRWRKTGSLMMLRIVEGLMAGMGRR
jgi:hypothetical protein